MRTRSSRRWIALVALTVLALPGASAGAATAEPTITTLAGGVPTGLPGTGVSVKPSAVTIGPDGDVYIADPGSGIVWRQEPDGTIHHVAGSGRLCLPDPARCRNEGGAAKDAFFTALSGIAVAADGDIFVSENRANIVRRIDAQSGIVTTVAGDGGDRYNPEDEGVPATEASLWGPGTLALDSQGNLFIADIWNRRIRRVATDGTITTVAGCGSQSYPVCWFHAQDGAPIDGTPIGANAGINGNGWGMAIGPGDRLLIADAGQILEVDFDEEIYRVIIGKGFQYAGFPGEGEGGPAADARIAVAVAMAFGPDGSLYFMEGGGTFVAPWNRVQKIDAPVTPQSIVRHVGGVGTGADYGGDGGDAKRARFSFSQPTGTWTGQGIAVDDAGNVYVTDVRNERLRRIEPRGIVTTFAGNGYGGAAPYMYTATDFHPMSGLTKGLTLRGGLSGDGRQATTAQLFGPSDVETDRWGNVYVLDRYNQRVRRVAPDGTITTVAGSGCVGEDCGSRQRAAPLGDGGPATAAQLLGASGIALDRTGTQLYIADDWHARIRQVNLGTSPFTAYPLSTAPVTIAPGEIETVFGPGIGVAMPPGTPMVPHYGGCWTLKPYCGEGLPAGYGDRNRLGDVATDAAGNLYIADAGASHVWKVDAATGTVTNVAGVSHRSNCYSQPANGQPGRVTELCSPTSLHVGPDGSLYVAETGGLPGSFETLPSGYQWRFAARVRKIDLGDPLYRSTVIAGGGLASSGGDGGPATRAALAAPHGIAAAPDGTVYIADTGNHRIRKIAPDGTISTIAGDGEFRDLTDYDGCDFRGDGGPAAAAQLCAPLGIALGPGNTLYVADAINNRVRAIRL